MSKKEQELKEREPEFYQIKAQNGEKFAQAIRRHLSAIFEVPDIVNIVKYAGYDAEPIMKYLISLKKIQIEEHGVYETPFQLLKKVGYNAYYADTLEGQNAIQKYFAKGEEICTFRDPDRFKNYYIINAVKENVDEIKRENFSHPERQDEYGTSVISIQILKNGEAISIKNRYNHRVRYADNTFDSHPDNIILGLGESLKRYFNVDFSSKDTPLPDGYREVNGQIIKYSHEINNVYFGEDCYFKDGKIYELNNRTEVMLDYFIFSNETKALENPADLDDAFIDAFNEEIRGKKIRIDKDKQRNYHIYADGIEILEVYNGEITKLNFPNVTSIGDSFLCGNQALTEISLPNVTSIGNGFLRENQGLTNISLPNVTSIGDDFLCYNYGLTNISLPYVTSIGYGFLCGNQALTELSLPNVASIGDDFLCYNQGLTNISLPNVTSIGNDFLYGNQALTELALPNLTSIGGWFLCENQALTKLSLPNLTSIKDYFLRGNQALTELSLPNVTSIGNFFLGENQALTELALPNVTSIGNDFLRKNQGLTNISLPNVTSIGDDFLDLNQTLTELYLPNVTSIGYGFLCGNQGLTNISLPNVTSIGDDFLFYNQDLTELALPYVTSIGNFFLSENQDLTELSLPNVTSIGNFFLSENQGLTNISLPNLERIDLGVFLNNEKDIPIIQAIKNRDCEAVRKLSRENMVDINTQQGKVSGAASVAREQLERSQGTIDAVISGKITNKRD